jgi:DNA repair protein RadC
MSAAFVREVATRYTGPEYSTVSPLRAPADVARLARELVEDDAREHFVAVFLDARHRPIGCQVVSIGTASASLIHPREVFQAAVGVGACAIVLAHNHPSDDPSPSAEDREITSRLSRAGGVLGIRILDHVVWTRSGGFYSFQESEPDHLVDRLEGPEIESD